MALLWAALAMSLALGAGFVVINHTTVAPETTAASLTDDQAAAQVVDSARQIVEVARLQDRTSNDVRSLDGVENVRVEPRGLDKPVLVVNDSSFNWGDAGIGAGFAFAAILLAAAAALSIKQHGRLGQV